MTDRELLLAYAEAGDRESLGAFLERYQVSLVRFITTFLGDMDAAQDVVQETFLEVARNPKRLLDVTSCHNWLLRVARNLGVDRIRREARARRHAAALKERMAAGTKTETAADALERAELKDTVRAEIDGLEPRLREIVLLKVQEEKSYREIAHITGLTVTNVGYLLHRAMKLLAIRLNHSRGVI